MSLSPDLATFLNFERDHPGGSPAGWGGGPQNSRFVDDIVVHSGKWAARIERIATSKGAVASLAGSVPVDFVGQRIELRGFLRTENVTEHAGLWLREDRGGEALASATMRNQQLKGTTDWREYSITLPFRSGASSIAFGVSVAGTGKAWADDLQLLVDGMPIWQAPKAAGEPTGLARDREFDHGSKIELRDITPLQVENLAALGRVWGFLKYHHPKVSSGQMHWDYELFRVMPSILAATDRTAANELIAQWLDGLGELKPGSDSKLSETDLYLRPEIGWIGDEARLGKRLSDRLGAVHAARSVAGSQFYVSLAASGVGNPVFEHEPDYPQIKFPDTGYQLLALFRFWNIIRYWSPYRDLLDENWDAVLAEFIPRLGEAATPSDYRLALSALAAKVRDTHTSLTDSVRVRPPFGEFQLPAVLRFIEGRATVVRALVAPGEAAPALQRGDVILEIDGTPVETLVERWSPYYAASNEPTRLREIARNMGLGRAGPVRVLLQRGDARLDLVVTRFAESAAADPDRGRHDLPGPAFRLLSKDVAYLKLSAVESENAKSYVEQAAGTKGWIIDIRNYPRSFVVFALGSHFVAKPTEFARFTIGNISNPGAFSFRRPVVLQPQAPHYSGKVVILADEVTQSSAEYTAMAFRAAPGAIVVGSTTAGADGNASRFQLPGGYHTMISGIGIFYPDKRPTQRIGIVPDIEVRPTLAGIRAGRDEVLEAALRQILGLGVSDDEIRNLVPARE